ncbi:hypothetical protein, partial [Geomesophilobacter sediminis]|uniref:hypothetical protein n=1 Tax=Geomesophilobacter sediminis TaxID=2798584 RepID=UPI001C0712CC
ERAAFHFWSRGSSNLIKIVQRLETWMNTACKKRDSLLFKASCPLWRASRDENTNWQMDLILTGEPNAGSVKVDVQPGFSPTCQSLFLFLRLLGVSSC